MKEIIVQEDLGPQSNRTLGRVGGMGDPVCRGICILAKIINIIANKLWLLIND